MGKVDLGQLKKELLADGVIDVQECKKIREILFEDGVIDRKEAEFLFDINDAVSGKANAREWADLFAEAIASHLLQDEDSPGVIDEAEAKWLAAKIQGDGALDATEKKLLQRIKKDAKTIHPALKALLAQA